MVEVSDGTFTDQVTVTIQLTDLVETFVEGPMNLGLISIYPNPTTGILYIDLPDIFRHGLEVELVDLRGREIFIQTGNVNRVDLSSFQKGVYFITIRSKDFVTTRKIVKL